jgi:hypothetical protein
MAIDTWAESSCISQQASANLITLELYVPYLLIREIKLTAEGKVYAELQTEQLNTRCNIYVKSVLMG